MSDTARNLRGLLMGHHGCTCDATESLRAVFAGKEPPLCEVHDVDRIAERNKARKLDALARADLAAEAIQRRVTEALFPTPTPTPERPITDIVHELLGGTSTGDDKFPLNGPEIEQKLGALGFTTHEGDHS